MKKRFWIDSWKEGGRKTSFHRSDIHPYVLKYLYPEKLKNKRILVPLCGKSVDLVYFSTYAREVIGVELVTDAVLQFFEEQGLSYIKEGNVYKSGNLTIINSDFFILYSKDVGHIDIVYDRASLVALPISMRRQYIHKIEELLPPGAQQFVNTLEYYPLKPEPPFSISPQELNNYYGNSHTITHLESPIIQNHGLKRAWGLDYVKEHGFMLIKDKML